MSLYMAIRHKIQSDTYLVYWKDPYTKKQCSKSFKTKKEAEKFNAEILYKLKYNTESFKPKEATPSISLSQLLQEYLNSKPLRPKYKYYFNLDTQYSIKYLDDIAISDITEAKLIDLVNHLLSLGTKSTTASLRYSRVKILLAYAIHKKYIAKLDFPSMSHGVYEKFIPPTLEEVRTLYNVASPKLKRVLVLGAYLGVRVGPSEMFQLTWNDVDFNKDILRIHGSYKNKESPWRDVPIHSTLVPLFKAWYDTDTAMQCKYIVHNTDGTQVNDIYTEWRNLLNKSSIERHIRPYDLRHTFGTELVNQGVDIGTIAKLMGHTDPTMLLKHYQYVSDKAKQSAIEKLPSMTL